MTFRQALIFLFVGGLIIIGVGALVAQREFQDRQAQKQIVTIEIVAPDGQPSTVKGIIGGEPITLTDQGGETWTLHVTGVETK